MTNFKYLDLDYSEVFIFDDFIVKQIKEGEHVDERHFDELKLLIETHFKNKPLVYISNRIHSYSISPLVYNKLSELDNILGIAIIASNTLIDKNAKFEKNFCSKPFEIFSNLSEACVWVNELIYNNEKS